MSLQLVSSSISKLAEAERRITGAVERERAAARLNHLCDSTGRPFMIFDGPLSARAPEPMTLERREKFRALGENIVAIQIWHASHQGALR